MFKILKHWILIPDKRNKYYVMKWSTRRGPLATFAECTKCGSKIHHWCKKIRSHLSCVAWSSLVTSATKDNLQDCHFAPFYLQRLTVSQSRRCPAETVTICSIRTAIHSKQGRLHRGSGSSCLPSWVRGGIKFPPASWILHIDQVEWENK